LEQEVRVTTTDHEAMGLALAEAASATATGDVPVGAIVLAADGTVLGRGHNLREAEGDPLAHAEVVALRDAARTLGGWRLDGATLVVTLEPCTMCAGALLAARVGRLVFGAWDEKAGAVGSVLDVVRDRRPATGVEVVAGVREAESAELLRAFFAPKRRSGDPVTPSRG
jgi:tRNA(adenine34) deaminase